MNLINKILKSKIKNCRKRSVKNRTGGRCGINVEWIKGLRHVIVRQHPFVSYVRLHREHKALTWPLLLRVMMWAFEKLGEDLPRFHLFPK